MGQVGEPARQGENSPPAARAAPGVFNWLLDSLRDHPEGLIVERLKRQVVARAPAGQLEILDEDEAVGGPNEALGSGPVSRAGEFEVVVSPPFHTLGNIAPCQNDRSTVLSAPESLRVASAKLEFAGQPSSFVTRNEGRGAPKEVINVYADQTGTVQGQVECTGRYRVTYRFDLGLVRGWNLVLVSTEIADEATREAIATYTSVNEAEVAAFGWFAYVP